MSKVVFVRPPNLQKSGDYKKQGVIRCPLNLALLASYIREKGNYTCSIVDFEIIEENNITKMANIILNEKPNYICFTTLTPRFPIVSRIAKEIKNIPIIIGGPHFTGNPEDSLCDNITYGIRGEGEEALLELLNSLEEGKDISNLQNLVFKTKVGVHVNPTRPYIKNLDTLPPPAWDLMKLNEYVDPNYFEGPHVAIFTTRGCPYNCKFCASCVTWNRKVRFNSVDRVINDIKYIVNTLGIRNIMFHDDNFTSNKRRAIEICKRIISEKLDIKYTMQVRADNVDKELIANLKDSGCQFAAIGVESGNQDILKSMGKRETKEQFRNAIKILKDFKLPSIASYIFGFPEDTNETIKETIDFAEELNADQSKFMILSAYPGTEYFRLAKERHLVDQLSLEQMENLNFYDHVSINLSKVSNKDLLRYQDEAYKKFDKNYQKVSI